MANKVRNINEDKIIDILNDLFFNPDYFEKLKEEFSFDESVANFISFTNIFRDRISDRYGYNPELISTKYITEKTELLRLSKYSEVQQNDQIEELKKRKVQLTTEEINEFKCAIEKLRPECWKRYTNKLRQQKHKASNLPMKQIQLYDADFYLLSKIKSTRSAQDWGHFCRIVADDNKKLRELSGYHDADTTLTDLKTILDKLNVKNMREALMMISELLVLSNTDSVNELIEKIKQGQPNNWT